MVYLWKRSDLTFSKMNAFLSPGSLFQFKFSFLQPTLYVHTMQVHLSTHGREKETEILFTCVHEFSRSSPSFLCRATSPGPKLSWSFQKHKSHHRIQLPNFPSWSDRHTFVVVL